MSEPDYASLGIAAGELADRYRKLSLAVDGEDDAESRLPRRLGLLNGFCILALVDPAFQVATCPGMPDLASAAHHVRSIGGIRNRSILAHGTATLGPREFEKIRFQAQLVAEVVMPEMSMRTLVTDLTPPALETVS